MRERERKRKKPYLRRTAGNSTRLAGRPAAERSEMGGWPCCAIKGESVADGEKDLFFTLFLLRGSLRHKLSIYTSYILVHLKIPSISLINLLLYL